MLVPERGLEPPLPCENQVLNLARLPIPPFGHKWFIAEQFHCARHLLLCQRRPRMLLQTVANEAESGPRTQLPRHQFFLSPPLEF
jgi:hypothetical protein